MLRKQVIICEEIFHEGGPLAHSPLRKAAIVSIIHNPFSGRYEENIVPFVDVLAPLGLEMAGRLIDVLGGDASAIQGYGKGAIVGSAGELEHGALWHVPGGLAMREKLGDVKAMVPSAKKVAGLGAEIDIPLCNVQASFVRSHYDSMALKVSDAPMANELAFILVMSTGPRVHARVGGLKLEDVIGMDGLK